MGTGQGNVLITTIWKGTAVIQAIKLFSPSKIYFIVDEPIDEIRNNSISMVKELFPEITYTLIPVKIYDIVGITKAVMNVINMERDNKITLHISEGRKTMSLGLLFGSYVKRKLVDSVFYITEETNTAIKLPLIELKLSEQKISLLNKLNSGIYSVNDLETELGIKAPTIYVHMKELRDDGFLNQGNKITEMGKIMLLNKE